MKEKGKEAVGKLVEGIEGICWNISSEAIDLGKILLTVLLKV